jgi:hypothetical protein
MLRSRVYCASIAANLPAGLRHFLYGITFAASTSPALHRVHGGFKGPRAESVVVFSGYDYLFYAGLFTSFCPLLGIKTVVFAWLSHGLTSSGCLSDGTWISVADKPGRLQWSAKSRILPRRSSN